MYKSGEYVLKNGFGILEVKDTFFEKIGVGASETEYYKLQSIDGKTSVSVPVKRAETLLCPLLKPAEAKKIMENVLTYAVSLDPNEKIRRKMLETNASSGRDGCLIVLGSLYKRILSGKKLSFYEKNALETAENKIFGEIAFVLRKEKCEIKAMVYDNLGIC